MKRYQFWCVILITIAEAAFAQNPPSLAEGIAFHNRALAIHQGGTGDLGAAIRQGKTLLEPLSASSPLAKAYLGSLITLEASQSSKTNPIKALAQLGEGTGLIDEALAAEGDSAALHTLRLANSCSVSESSPLKRWKAAAEDIDWFHSHRPALDRNTQADVFLYEGVYYLKAGDIDRALESFESCAELAPGSPSAGKARDYLARYGE
jgi:tetratricopeptide (TPR) repeat protein